MTRRTPRRAAVALALLLLPGCDDHLVGARGVDLPCDRDPPLTWETFGRGHLAEHCTGCHSGYLASARQREGAPPGIDFDTWEDLLRHADRVWVRGVRQGGMPPGGGPDQQEQQLFEEWMACEVLPAAGFHPGAL